MKSHILFALAMVLQCVPTSSSGHSGRVRHETRANHSPWEKRDGVPSSTILPIRIALTQQNLDYGHDLLMDISDPKSVNYSKFYTQEQVHDLFAPSDESMAAVKDWLKDAGVALDTVSRSANRQWLQFHVTAQHAQSLLGTNLHFYEHKRDGRMALGCDEYFIPEALQSHIDYVTPGLNMIELKVEPSSALRRRQTHNRSRIGPIFSEYPKLPRFEVSRDPTEYCNELITPACIFAMYNITEGWKATPGNELGIYEENPQFVDSTDLNDFFENAYPRIPQGTFPVVVDIDGAVNDNNKNDGGSEALLDFQISYPIIYPQNSKLFLTNDAYVGENDSWTGLFNNFLDAIDGSYCTFSAYGETGNNNTVDPTYPNPGYEHLHQCGTYEPTHVISLSYGLAEFNEGTSENYQKRQCLEYMKLGIQGVTVVFASGDDGVSSPWGCQTNAQGEATIFNPGFPASCPYVTSVGATTLVGKVSQDEEIAVTQFGSGGGFSNYFPRPEYQKHAVEDFFKSANGPSYPYYEGPHYNEGIYNRSGRGYPDVSSVGQNIVTFGNGNPYLVAGTSAAAPTFAAIITRINEERLHAGKKPVGFINPVLYQHPWAFHDIANGTNPGCGTDGFTAGPGWDPLTGLGTPDYPALLKVFMDL